MNLSELVAGAVVSASPTTSATALAQLMEAEGVGSVAILDGDGEFVGIVTDRDLVRLVAESGKGNTKAEEIMTRHPDTVDIDTDISDAADWMNATGYRHLPVTEEAKLVGMVSIKDLLWALAER